MSAEFGVGFAQVEMMIQNCESRADRVMSDAQRCADRHRKKAERLRAALELAKARGKNHVTMRI